MLPQNLDEWARFVQAVGFPVAVAAYVLIRLERRLLEVRDAVRDLVHLTGGRRQADDRRGGGWDPPHPPPDRIT